MKKQILLFALSCMASFGFAQTTDSKISFGAQAGLASYSLKGDAVKSLNSLIDYADGMITTKSRTGFYAGGFANIPIGGQFSVEPGVYYTQKGYELNGDLNLKGLEFLGANASAKLQSEYIDIPVLLKADMGGLNIFAGPQVSYLVKSDLRITAGVLGINILNQKIDATSQFNRWDASVTGGVGYKFDNINLGASYDYGLGKVDANKSFKSYNRGFKIGVGISF
ncbi:MAG: porin family protein [Ferruginibacter sp.]